MSFPNNSVYCVNHYFHLCPLNTSIMISKKLSRPPTKEEEQKKAVDLQEENDHSYEIIFDLPDSIVNLAKQWFKNNANSLGWMFGFLNTFANNLESDYTLRAKPLPATHFFTHNKETYLKIQITVNLLFLYAFSNTRHKISSNLAKNLTHYVHSTQYLKEKNNLINLKKILGKKTISNQNDEAIIRFCTFTIISAASQCLPRDQFQSKYPSDEERLRSKRINLPRSLHQTTYIFDKDVPPLPPPNSRRKAQNAAQQPVKKKVKFTTSPPIKFSIPPTKELRIVSFKQVGFNLVSKHLLKLGNVVRN